VVASSHVTITNTIITEEKKWRKDDTTEDSRCKEDISGQQCHHLQTKRTCTANIRTFHEFYHVRYYDPVSEKLAD
jgi:hypothetical protein